ncbi:MAG: hypothetical protein AAFP93_01720 [Bacteroidota bacterium]
MKHRSYNISSLAFILFLYACMGNNDFSLGARSNEQSCGKKSSPTVSVVPVVQETIDGFDTGRLLGGMQAPTSSYAHSADSLDMKFEQQEDRQGARHEATQASIDLARDDVKHHVSNELVKLVAKIKKIQDQSGGDAKLRSEARDDKLERLVDKLREELQTCGERILANAATKEDFEQSFKELRKKLDQLEEAHEDNYASRVAGRKVLLAYLKVVKGELALEFEKSREAFRNEFTSLHQNVSSGTLQTQKAIDKAKSALQKQGSKYHQQLAHSLDEFQRTFLAKLDEIAKTQQGKKNTKGLRENKFSFHSST